MSTAAPRSFSVPGKIFVLGEYAVLTGAPALVASIGPRFCGVEAADSERVRFHPDSPAGKLCLEAGDVPAFRLDGAFRTGAGFGGSTAEFALAYRVLAEQRGWTSDWTSIWFKYRQYAPQASGADLAAQVSGGAVVFSAGDFSHPTLHRMELSHAPFLVFSAADQAERKVATHRHLADLKVPPIAGSRELMESLTSGIAFASIGDWASLGRSMDQYANALASLGLECEATRADRGALQVLPGVLGVKGAGALQSDSVLVLTDGNLENQRVVIETAERRGLRWIDSRLASEEGIRCEK